MLASMRDPECGRKMSSSGRVEVRRERERWGGQHEDGSSESKLGG